MREPHPTFGYLSADVSRRRFLGGLGSAAFAAAFLAACGGDEDDTATSSAASAAGSAGATGTAAEASTPDADGTAVGSAFPVTIQHKFGAAEIPSEPQRVLTIGFSEQDPVLALGVAPVAVREWFGEQPHAIWPWATEALGDARPDVLVMPFGELDFEAITALAPDLIVGTHSGITQVEYETLARIAPTLAQPAEFADFGVPWQEQTRLIARALGREERATALIGEVESAIEATAASHPEFQGATVAWVTPAAGEGQYNLTGPNTPPLRFLAGLGFRMPDALLDIVGEESSAQISGEQVHLLDVDVLITLAQGEEARAALEDDPLLSPLAVMREGRTVFFTAVDDPTYAALSFSTALSLPFALETLTPRLAAAVDGEPATSADVPSAA